MQLGTTHVRIAKVRRTPLQMHNPSDFDLKSTISSVKSGDRDAFRQIVRHFGLPLRAFLASQLHHLDDADDLAQDVFLAAFNHLDRFRTEEDFGAWLRGIARNKLKTYFRSHSRRQSAMERFRNEVAEVMEVDFEKLAGDLREEQVDRLLSCISRLPDKMRRIVRAGLEGQRAAELCDELEMKVGALYTMNHRANKLLRECMIGESA